MLILLKRFFSDYSIRKEQLLTALSAKKPVIE